jgi:hypothetical protein
MIDAVKAFLLLATAALWLSVALFGRQSVARNAGAVLSGGWIFIAVAGLGAASILPSTIADVTSPSFGGVSMIFLVTVAAAAGPLVIYASTQMHWLGKAIGGWAVMLGLADLYVADADQTPSALVEVLPFLLFAVAAPAHALAAWTADDSHVGARSLLQGMLWTGFLLWGFPSIALAAEGRDWSIFLERTPSQHIFWLIPLAVPATLITAALWQFAREGGGTGFPYDPPKRLVCHGIYAYLSNPMQLGIVLATAWWGVVLQSPVVLTSAPVAALLFIVFSDVCSGVSNVAINDPGWRVYKRNVPAWRPRLSPWRAPVEETST